MKATFHENDGNFGLELVPETHEETLRVMRLGMLAKKGSKTFVSISRECARMSVTFDKNKNSHNYFIK